MRINILSDNIYVVVCVHFHRAGHKQWSSEQCRLFKNNYIYVYVYNICYIYIHIRMYAPPRYLPALHEHTREFFVCFVEEGLMRRRMMIERWWLTYPRTFAVYYCWCSLPPPTIIPGGGGGVAVINEPDPCSDASWSTPAIVASSNWLRKPATCAEAAASLHACMTRWCLHWQYRWRNGDSLDRCTEAVVALFSVERIRWCSEEDAGDGTGSSSVSASSVSTFTASEVTEPSNSRSDVASDVGETNGAAAADGGDGSECFDDAVAIVWRRWRDLRLMFFKLNDDDVCGWCCRWRMDASAAALRLFVVVVLLARCGGCWRWSGYDGGICQTTGSCCVDDAADAVIGVPVAVNVVVAAQLVALALLGTLATMHTVPVSLVAVTVAGGCTAAMWPALAVSGNVTAVAMGDGGATAADVSSEPTE